MSPSAVRRKTTSRPQPRLSPDVEKFTMQISQNPTGDCIPVAAVNERSKNTTFSTRRVETRPLTTCQLRRPPQHYTQDGGKYLYLPKVQPMYDVTSTSNMCTPCVYVYVCVGWGGRVREGQG